jgi:hypothetical protein
VPTPIFDKLNDCPVTVVGCSVYGTTTISTLSVRLPRSVTGVPVVDLNVTCPPLLISARIS